MSDEMKKVQRKHEEKRSPYTELAQDVGGLGKTGRAYEEKVRGGHGLHNPRDGMKEARQSYARKERQPGNDETED
jgi:hypothetical protein